MSATVWGVALASLSGLELDFVWEIVSGAGWDAPLEFEWERVWERARTPHWVREHMCLWGNEWELVWV